MSRASVKQRSRRPATRAVTATTAKAAAADPPAAVDNAVRRDRLVGWVMTVTGLVGALAAFVLTVEKILLLQDPSYVPTCSINPILSCGSIMSSDQASAFGFPNPLLGLALFPVLATIGVVTLAGAVLPRWVWLSTQAGVTFAAGFVHWLIFQSLYRIGALCPYCMVVWVAAITAFWYVTLSNVERGAISVPTRVSDAVAALRRVHTFGLAVWFLVVAVLILIRFWDSWLMLAA